LSTVIRQPTPQAFFIDVAQHSYVWKVFADAAWARQKPFTPIVTIFKVHHT
jgi:hypothetical protein